MQTNSTLKKRKESVTEERLKRKWTSPKRGREKKNKLQRKKIPNLRRHQSERGAREKSSSKKKNS